MLALLSFESFESLAGTGVPFVLAGFLPRPAEESPLRGIENPGGGPPLERATTARGARVRE
jgi:hypothetical protein